MMIPFAVALRELDNYPEGEVSEMIALFESRGMSHSDATEVITRMAKYKTFFLNLMMTEELALPVPPACPLRAASSGLALVA